MGTHQMVINIAARAQKMPMENSTLVLPTKSTTTKTSSSPLSEICRGGGGGSSDKKDLPRRDTTSRHTPHMSDDNEGTQLLSGKIDKQSAEYVIRSGIAGGTAGCAAKTIIAPLDRVKILFQTANPEFRKYSGSFLGFYRAGKHIVHTTGYLGLFQGHSLTILRMAPYAGIKFVAYEQIRAILIPDDTFETPLRRLLSGSISGVITVFATYPLDLMRVRLAYASGGSIHGRLLRTVKKVASETTSPQQKPGFRISNFYAGFFPTICGIVPYAGVSFLAHDTLHDVFRYDMFAPWTVQENTADQRHQLDYYEQRPPLKVWAQLLAGGLSGVCAQTASYPLELVRRRMQVSGASGHRYSMGQTFARIFREQGVKGFFVGLSIGYLKIFPMFATTFYVYERMKYLLHI